MNRRRSKRKSALLEKSIRCIIDYLHSDSMPESGRLPSLRTLSTMAGVSIFTMSRAARKLATKKVIEIRKNSGLWKAGARSHTAAAPARRYVSRSRWKSIRAAILRDIYAGRYARYSMLPGMKELAMEYGTSAETLSRAVKALIDEKIIHPFKRGLKVRSVTQSRSNATIVLVVQRRQAPETQRIYMPLEEACGVNNLLLRIARFEYHNEALAELHECGQDIARFVRGNTVIGFFLLPGGGVINKNKALHLVDMLVPYKLPVSVLAAGGEADVVSLEKKYPLFSFHDFNWNRKPGEIVGRYLLEMGHRSLAYISRTSSGHWTRRRCIGLCDIVHSAGDDARVRMYVIRDGPEDNPAPIDAGKDAFCEYFRKMTAGGGKRAAGRGPKQLGDADLRFPEIIVVPDLRSAVDLVLKHEDTTAIVGENDSAALDVLSILQERGVKVPGRISLVGFDNTTQALARGLTSYSQNYTGAAHAALYYILNFGVSRKRPPVRTFETEGAVIQRESVAAFVRGN